jgi:hypothetical protein
MLLNWAQFFERIEEVRCIEGVALLPGSFHKIRMDDLTGQGFARADQIYPQQDALVSTCDDGGTWSPKYWLGILHGDSAES